MKPNKAELEDLIRKERTVGSYVFDEDKQCFFCDTEVELHISKLAPQSYRSELYYFDGYEVYLEEQEKTSYTGDETVAKQKAIDSYQFTFMEYPVKFTNVSCYLM